jgi:hypothetical protein
LPQTVAKSRAVEQAQEMPISVYGFMDQEEKDNHFLDHNHEFEPEFASAEEYEAAAIAFLSCPLSATMLECVRLNGDRIRFNQTTDEFAICARD